MDITPPRQHTKSSILAVVFACIACVAVPTVAAAQSTTASAIGTSGTSSSVPLLARALQTIDTPESQAALRTSNSPAARAWLAYLAHHAGHDAEAERQLAGLDPDGTSLAPDGSPIETRILFLIRAQTELLGAESSDLVPSLPCAVFRWDPEAARRAFGAAHGSSRDSIIAPFKRRCVDEALTPSQRGSLRSAVTAFDAALFGRWPVPEDGTYWISVAILTHEQILDSLLFVRSGMGHEARTPLAPVAGLDSTDRRRVRGFLRDARGSEVTLARIVCDLVNGTNVQLAEATCRARARASTRAAFAEWHGALERF